MSWNNAAEYARFRREQEAQAETFRKAGMTEAQIEEIYQFDLKVFHQKRKIVEHEQEMPHFCGEENMDDNNPLMQEYSEAFSITDEYFADERMSWTDRVKSSDLNKTIEKLDKEELEIITLHVMEGYSLTEIAQMNGVTPVAVCKQFKKIRNKFQKEING